MALTKTRILSGPSIFSDNPVCLAEFSCGDLRMKHCFEAVFRRFSDEFPGLSETEVLFRRRPFDPPLRIKADVHPASGCRWDLLLAKAAVQISVRCEVGLS